jgi:hypothetical protein
VTAARTEGRADGGVAPDGAQRRLGHAHDAVDVVDAHPLPVAGRERVDDLVGDRGGSDEVEVEVRVSAASAQSAVNHDGGSVIPAEEVDGDPRGARVPVRSPRPRDGGR